jgi:hypothetical protein
MNEKYQPHTNEDQEAYQNGFEYAIWIVMELLNKREAISLSMDRFIGELRYAINKEVKIVREEW